MAKLEVLCCSLPYGRSGSSILRRSLQYLYPLALSCKRDDSTESGMNIIETDKGIGEIVQM